QNQYLDQFGNMRMLHSQRRRRRRDLQSILTQAMQPTCSTRVTSLMRLNLQQQCDRRKAHGRRSRRGPERRAVRCASNHQKLPQA
ncbi:hypothetical protein, partial [Delftia tsuruhatensis]|uniref:hypothetical protein n=1 Tax=Delftia tsuruhatensis TaxID=180282 RepID=UPI002449AD7B